MDPFSLTLFGLVWVMVLRCFEGKKAACVHTETKG